MPAVDVHQRSASMHEDAAQRHEWAAEYWEEHGVRALAKLERRFALNERAAAKRERSRALGDPGPSEQRASETGRGLGG